MNYFLAIEGKKLSLVNIVPENTLISITKRRILIVKSGVLIREK